MWGSKAYLDSDVWIQRIDFHIEQLIHLKYRLFDEEKLVQD